MTLILQLLFWLGSVYVYKYKHRHNPSCLTMRFVCFGWTLASENKPKKTKVGDVFSFGCAGHRSSTARGRETKNCNLKYDHLMSQFRLQKFSKHYTLDLWISQRWEKSELTEESGRIQLDADAVWPLDFVLDPHLLQPWEAVVLIVVAVRIVVSCQVLTLLLSLTRPASPST